MQRRPAATVRPPGNDNLRDLLTRTAGAAPGFGAALAKRLPLAACLALCLGVASASAAEQWPSYNNTLDSRRYSPLRLITARIVGDLREACELDLGDLGPFESGLLVVGDTLYVTTSTTTVALNAVDCSEKWRHVYVHEEVEVFHTNRGMAYLDGRIFRGTNDGRLLALDARTGRELWRVKAGDPNGGEFFSAAPVAWKGRLFIGPSGGDWGIRGRVAAFDAATGRELWRFDTIPMGAEPGAETWTIPPTAQHGGGATWTSYTLDTASGELFVPVGNPAPDLNAASRPGANLYTDSLVVLDAKTGKLKWFYQFRANDDSDWDTSAAPVLYRDREGRPRVALGTKDGNVYSFDRATHALRFKTPVTTIVNEGEQTTAAGIRKCPGSLGGVEWNGPAYSDATRYLYVGAVDWCYVFKSGEPKYSPPHLYLGTAFVPSASEPQTGWITALDATTGSVKWQFHAPAPVMAGITPTAGGFVLGGDLRGNLYAFDSLTGEVLLKTTLPGSMAGGIVTYAVHGRQYVAATAGHLSRGSLGTVGTPHVVILTTGLPVDRPVIKLAVTHDAAVEAGSDEQQGKATFTAICSACHGSAGEGGAGPALKNVSNRKTYGEIMAFIKNPSALMPRLYPEPLDDEAVRKVALYLETLRD